MVWGTIIGISLLAPFVILQLSKIAVDPDKKWEYVTAFCAIIGIACIAVVG